MTICFRWFSTLAISPPYTHMRVEQLPISTGKNPSKAAPDGTKEKSQYIGTKEIAIYWHEFWILLLAMKSHIIEAYNLFSPRKARSPLIVNGVWAFRRVIKQCSHLARTNLPNLPYLGMLFALLGFYIIGCDGPLRNEQRKNKRQYNEYNRNRWRNEVIITITITISLL